MSSAMKSLVYGMVDLWTRGQGVARSYHGEIIRFPARWSRFYPTGFEPEKFRFLRARCRPGATVFDLGAHIGLYTVLMARCVGPSGRVFSFEPTPFTRAILEKTVQLNGCEGVVEVRKEAVSNITGKTDFYDTCHPVSNANSLMRGQRSKRKLTVEVVTIDEFVAARGLTIGCLKANVEGAELDVLRGAERTIRAQHPVLDLSVHPHFMTDPQSWLEELWNQLGQFEMVVTHRNRPVERDWFLNQRDGFDVEVVPL